MFSHYPHREIDMSAAVAHISRRDETEPVVVQYILNLRDMQDGNGHSHVVTENPNWAKITTFVTLDLVGQIVSRPRFITSAARFFFPFLDSDHIVSVLPSCFSSGGFCVCNWRGQGHPASPRGHSLFLSLPTPASRTVLRPLTNGFQSDLRSTDCELLGEIFYVAPLVP